MNTLLGQNLGQYRIVEKIGEGGMATVYKAFQPSLDRYVALKVLPPVHADRPAFGERFEREARAIAQLAHPNILPVYDYGQEADYRYLVMRYVEGAATLKDVMKSPHSLTLAADLVAQVASALGHAHKQGIIHRDVKPSNVMMDGQWALLTDFGLAKMAEAMVELTGTGVGVGTPAYMSPEQGRGLPVDHRSDIYSLGIVLYEMLTGRIPHNADTPFAVVYRRITEPLPLPHMLNPEVPQAVEQVVLKALAPDPSHRFDSAEDMARALRQAVVGESVTLGGTGDVDQEQKTNAMPTQAIMTAFLSLPPKAQEGAKARPHAPAWSRLAVIVISAGLVGLLAFWIGRSQFSAGTGRIVDGPGDSASQVMVATSTRAAPVTVFTVTQSVSEDPATTPPATRTLLPPTPTPTSAPSATPLPSATPSPAATATVTPSTTTTPATVLEPTMAVAAVVQAEETSSSQDVPGTGSLLLAKPVPPGDPDFSVSHGPTLFEWMYDGTIAADQGFEVRVWREGEMPVGAHDSVADRRDGKVTSPAPNTFRINLDITDAAGVKGRTGDYLWTVLLVETDPTYRELGVQATPGRLRFEAQGGQGGAGSSPTF